MNRLWLRTHRRRLAAAGLLLAALAFWRSLPEPLFDAPLSTLLLARDGTLLGARIAGDGQWRFPPQAEVPEKFAQALIAYEDRRFAWHPGVDPLAVARALRLNLAHGRIVSGGSTLTMQVARLARGARQRGWWDKLVETLLALRLELALSKAEILALHAAHAPFGGNVVGLQAGAWRYFGRAPDQLSWAEACTLAVLPNSPALIHPGRNRAQLQARRDRLLQRLQAQGTISATDLALALREPLPEQPRALPQLAPHLLATLHRQQPQRARLASTLDVRLQSAAAALVDEQVRTLARQGVHNAAAIVIDNRSFEVLAYVGNADSVDEAERGQDVDVVRRPRSSGSILKPFLYAAMLDAGDILPGTLVADVPTQYGGYLPENFDRGYRGAVPAEVALAQSLNVPAVRMLGRYGVHRFYDLLGALGVSTLWRKPDDYGLTLILGGAEVTLYDIAALYANLADVAARAGADGRRSLRLLQPTAQEGTAAPVALRQAGLSPGAAWLTLQALLEVARPAEEGHWKNFASSRRIAWKTGTSWGQRDAWAVGVTTHHTVAVWVGNASGEGRAGLTGATAAAPLLFDLFNRLDAPPWFARPELHLREVEVCRNDGYLANGYCEVARQWAPRASQFDRVSPYNLRVHLDPSGRWRVHSGCERVSAMVHADWFALPPGPEFYYRRHHADYRALPPYRADCSSDDAARGARGPIDFIYPTPGTRVYIPVGLAEQKSRVVFEAVHREREALLHWHLDDVYLGSTRIYHQRAVDASAGEHTLTVVDAQGNRLSRRFEVLVRERP